MNHAEAVQNESVEKHLLGELSAAQQDEFAEHFFRCEECATDLRMTAMFLDATKRLLEKETLVSKPRRQDQWWRMKWFHPQYAFAASIALITIIVYQNAVMIPRLRGTITPQALESISLTDMGSRSATQTAIAPPHARPFLLLLDIPSNEGASGYLCEIQNQRGEKIFRVSVPDALSKHTVPLLVPPSLLTQGDYSLVILGKQKHGQPVYDEVERYQFHVR